MAKPLTVPTWATNTNFAAGVGVGLPTKNSPGSIAVDGWNYVARPNPTHFNYWQNLVGQWCSWVNTDVLSTDGGFYTMNSPLTLEGQGLTIADFAEFTVTDDSFAYFNGDSIFTATSDSSFVGGSTTTVDGDWLFASTVPVFHNGAVFSVGGLLSTSASVEANFGGPVAWKRVQGSTSGNQSVAQTTRYFVVPSAYGGGNAIVEDGTTIGQAMTFTSFSTGALLLKRANGSTNITDSDGDSITVIAGALGANDHNSVTILWNGTFWEYAGGG